uniref:NADH-ubiquinone oxidoreductase chain 5 n=1 Tax=Aphaenogaster famelica TaxID=255788 RepID=A0A6B9BJZ3_9HYME|nr:NADH dehydrogenase subunit 5 [Aphaenogaster famelica]QGW36311.1 NADH dehydrogenase subunit 5 [Aphaenogaster famelica]
MFNIFIYFVYMLLMFFIFFILSMGLFFMDYSVMMEWLMISVNSFNLEMYLLVDWISLLFISFIFLISSMIMLYSYMYMSNEIYMLRFVYLVVLFIMSMILMIISPNIVSILFGWDGLGLVSYCLVIFYQNYSSYNSGMVTVLSNRVGDIGILMIIGLMFMKGSWSIYMLMNNKLIILMLLVSAITKSAQIPFSIWLPLAMAAPTPVSALVHSSTLVTAGVYLMIRFNSFLMLSKMNFILFFLSILTMFMSGMMALVENDLKKIIALSTLSQLGLMMMILSIGFKMVAFYHLLTHAIFKSMLFMCAGIIIHSLNNNQDIRLLGGLNNIMPFTMMSLYISSMALCGYPFLAGFYSKDLIMELIYIFKVNIFMLILIMISLSLTVIYSFRLYYYIFFSEIKFYSCYNFKENGLMNMSMMILILLSIMIGSSLNWMFFFDMYLVPLSLGVKMITLELCFLGLILGMCMVMMNLFNKFYMLNYFLSSMWFLNYFYGGYKLINNLGVLGYKVDKTWVEFSSYLMLLSFIKNKNMEFSYKIYMFGNFFILFSVYMFLLW